MTPPVAEVSEPSARQRPVVDYDLYQGQSYAASGDLHQGLYELAERHGRGIFWTPHNGGHWFINDYELLFEAARQPELFSSTEMTIPPVPEERALQEAAGGVR